MCVIEAPDNRYFSSQSLFIAGGITDCPDWQSELIDQLADTKLGIYNPRRAMWPIHDPTASRQQIDWEFAHLKDATAISFWFPCETLCPITLFELGAWLNSQSYTTIFVGVHPDYKRRLDIEIQTEHYRPDIRICYSLSDLAGQIRKRFG